jgi:hypothetical protein
MLNRAPGLHNEELHNVYSSLNINRMIRARMMKRVGYVACMQEIRNVYRISVRKAERTMHRWECNIGN